MQRQGCGVRFQDLYTSGAYAARHPSWHVEESPWKAKEILRLMRRHRLAPRTVCEVGYGAADFGRLQSVRLSKVTCSGSAQPGSTGAGPGCLTASLEPALPGLHDAHTRGSLMS